MPGINARKRTQEGYCKENKTYKRNNYKRISIETVNETLM
jgi:hypothetical protein